jgi:hypothetical protein
LHLVFYDSQTGKKTNEVKGKFSNIAFEKTGKFFIAKEGDFGKEKIIKRQVTDGRLLKTYLSKLPSIEAISFSEDGNSIYAANSNGMVSQWIFSAGKMDTRIKADGLYKTNILLNKNGDMLFYKNMNDILKGRKECK